MAEEVMQKLVHTTKELHILKSINKTIESTESLDVLISKITKIINKELHVALIFIVLKSGDNFEIKNIEKSSLHNEFLELLNVIAKDTVKSSSPIFIRYSRPNTRLKKFGIKSMISAPLMSYSGPLGAIIIMAQRKNFSPAIFRILNSLAVQTASAIQHIWLKQSVAEKERELIKLYTKLYGKEAKRAIIDDLTGLYNKRYFIEFLKKEFGKDPLSLILFDIDFFKSYNDTYGHVEGDKLLKEIGKAVLNITKRIKIKTKACRYGGEEFAILINSNFDNAIKIAELLRKEIESLYPKKAKRRVTISLGVGKKKKRENEETFVKRVDSALYKAKQMGRNDVWAA